MSTTIHIPASIEEATEQLGAVERLLVARNWERAAIVAAFVQPSEQGVSSPKAKNRLSPIEFADLGIAGLRTKDTVRLYAQRWLDAHDGVHPEPGAEVDLPDDDWPPTRTGTNGHNSEQGVRDKIRDMEDKHGPDAVAAAIVDSAPGTAAAVEGAAIRDRVEAGTRDRDTTDRDELGDRTEQSRERARRRRSGFSSPGAQSLDDLTRSMNELTLRVAMGEVAHDPDEMRSAIAAHRDALGRIESFIDGRSLVWTTDDEALAADMGIDLSEVAS